MGVDIPQPFHSVLDGPVTVAGIPSTFTVNVGLPDPLPTIHLDVDELPKIQLGIDPVELRPIEFRPIELRLTEFPSIRGHLPADFCVGLSLFGMEIANIRLCGEAQIITEPYRPNPCVVCGPVIGRLPEG